MADTESAASRRPIKSRGWPFFQRLADWLARIGVSPNAISASSVVFSCGAGVTLAATSWAGSEMVVRALWLASAVLIQLRLVANLLDGMVAIEGGKKSAVGELFNEVPDRISDPAILVGAGFAVSGDANLGMLAAIVALFVAYVRAMGASVGIGQVFLGPMAKPHRMAVVTVVCVYCAIAPSSWQPLWDGERGVIAGALIVIIAGGAVTAIRRLLHIGRLMKQVADETE